MAKQKITREELIEIRKKELARKEMEQNIRHWTRMEEDEQRYTDMKFRDKNPWFVFLIRFGYVFIILQAIVFALGVFLPFVRALSPFDQIFIWTFSLLAGILDEKNFNHLMSLFR